jgi:hypothetical protein
MKWHFSCLSLCEAKVRIGDGWKEKRECMRAENRTNQNSRKKLLWIGLTTSLLIALTGCGKTEFTPTAIGQSQVAPGSFSIPPNVDILTVVDDTGSMYGVIDEINSEVPNFLKGLQNQKWNFHFAVAPLTTYRKIRQVAGSVYDSNYGSQWVPAYPGASATDSGMILSSFFRTADSFSDYISSSFVSNVQGGKEPGLENIIQTLNNGTPGTSFIRNGSLLVVLMIGNGNDTSRVNYCTIPGQTENQPCELVAPRTLCTPTDTDPTGGSSTCGSAQTSLDYYQSKFLSFKKNSQFYAAVATGNYDSCRGYRATKGSRYMYMANQLSGKVYNICTTPVSSVLTDLTSSLAAQKVDFKMRYLFLDEEPNPDTITVTRYVGGSTASPVVIPQKGVNNNTNGWTYEGKVQNVDVTYNPQNGTVVNQGSGYAIRLWGTAELSGSDTASVDFKPAGAQSSVSK